MYNLLGAVILGLSIAATGGWPQKGPVRVSLSWPDPTAAIYVGEPTQVRAVIENIGEGAVVVLDWEKYPDVVGLDMVFVADGDERQPDRYRFRLARGRPFLRGEFRSLNPGKATIERTLTPMLTGRFRVVANVEFPTDRWGMPGNEGRWENGVCGKFHVWLAGETSSEMSPAMKKRLDSARMRLGDSALTVAEKKTVLANVAEERHIFAARFLRDVFLAPESPACVKDSALAHLVVLAKFGTAYESMPLLLKAMLDEGTPTEVRISILEWVSQILQRQGRQLLADQLSYEYPKALQARALEAIQRMSSDRNPFVAAPAAKALRLLTEHAREPTR